MLIKSGGINSVLMLWKRNGRAAGYRKLQWVKYGFMNLQNAVTVHGFFGCTVNKYTGCSLFRQLLRHKVTITCSCDKDGAGSLT